MLAYRAHTRSGIDRKPRCSLLTGCQCPQGFLEVSVRRRAGSDPLPPSPGPCPRAGTVHPPASLLVRPQPGPAEPPSACKPLTPLAAPNSNLEHVLPQKSRWRAARVPGGRSPRAPLGSGTHTPLSTASAPHRCHLVAETGNTEPELLLKRSRETAKSQGEVTGSGGSSNTEASEGVLGRMLEVGLR